MTTKTENITKCPICGCIKRGYRRMHAGLLCTRCLRKDKTVTIKMGPAKPHSH